jgi:hypothetical protein
VMSGTSSFHGQNCTQVCVWCPVPPVSMDKTVLRYVCDVRYLQFPRTKLYSGMCVMSSTSSFHGQNCTQVCVWCPVPPVSTDKTVLRYVCDVRYLQFPVCGGRWLNVSVYMVYNCWHSESSFMWHFVQLQVCPSGMSLYNISSEFFFSDLYSFSYHYTFTTFLEAMVQSCTGY